VKVGDTVKYTITGDTPKEWTISSIWDTNTDDGKIACLTRKDETKRLGVDRCNAPLEDLSID
jgi:hypothetical protein